MPAMPNASIPPAPLTPLTWQQLPGAPLPGAEVGPLHSLTDGQANMVNLPAQGEPATDFKLLVLRNGQQVHAFANRCAHFGIPLAAKPAQLISTPLKSLTCNVHYARYRWADGSCEAGDCDGEGLLAVPLWVRPDGVVCIGQAEGTTA
jgi:nitrite reductase/ring-hydroxylating ferredoxin subunit